MPQRVACAVVVLGFVAFLLDLVYPALAAAASFITTADAHPFWLTPRQWGLLGRGFGVASAAGALALLFGTALAVGLRVRARWMQALLTACALTIALVPPYLIAYAWALVLLPEGLWTADLEHTGIATWLATRGRAALCLATWSAPVAALVLAIGWRGRARWCARLARLDGGHLATLRACASPMRSWVAAAWLITALLALNEYSVCHLCRVQTWNTEILSELQLLATAGTALRLAWPLVLVAAAAGVVAVLARSSWSETLHAAFASDADDPGAGSPSRSWWPPIAWFAAAALFGAPFVLLVAHLEDGRALGRTWYEFPRHWPDALRIAAGAAILCALQVVALSWLQVRGVLARRRRWAWRVAGGCLLMTALLGALVPPALVGDAFAAAYVRLPVLRDSLWIVALVGAARFAVLPCFAAWVAMRSDGRRLIELASIDGAGAMGILAQVTLPRLAPPVLAACAAAGVLSLGEVAASQMITPPGVQNLALTLLNQIHFGRRDEVILLSLSVIAAAALVAGAGQWLAGVRGGGADGQGRRARRAPVILSTGARETE